MRKDIDLNFVAHPLTGDLAMKQGLNAVDQSIRNIVLTNYYERGFNVELGSNLQDSLFENYTLLTEQTIKNNIKKAIKNFEPMAELIDILTEMSDSNELTVKIYYTYLNDPAVRTVNIPIRRIR